jgi:hypothetical protein
MTYLLDLCDFSFKLLYLLPAIQRSIALFTISSALYFLLQVDTRSNSSSPITFPHIRLSPFYPFTHISHSIPLDPLDLFPHFLNISPEYLAAHTRLLLVQVLLFQRRRDSLKNLGFLCAEMGGFSC